MKKILLSCLFVAAIAAAAIAQTHATQPTETVGLISEPVARQRLQQQGYNVQSLSLQEGQYRAVATKDGKRVIVWMDAKSGHVEERKEP
jgi:hypothetical protein